MTPISDEIKYAHFRSGLALQNDGNKLEGYALVYDSLSEPISEEGRTFREVVKRGAASDALKAKDIRAIFEHDPRQLLGRTSSGTLRLREDEKGVAYSIDLPKTRLGDDVRELVGRGDISGASVEMRLRYRDRRFYRSNGELIHEISKLSSLPEITITSGPAYSQTSAVLRSLIQWDEQQNPPQIPLVVRYRKALVEGL